MTNQEILSEFSSLPAEAQSQVINLIVFLKQQYIEAASPSMNADLTDDAFIGMWRDRQDLGSTTWVRNLRENEWSRTHG